LAHKGQQYFVPIELFLRILHTLSQVLKPLLGGTGDVKSVELQGYESGTGTRPRNSRP
jgi:hypothetical protein